ncbi:unnamed protein product [Paramecium pentaurelia]|uniref:Uncharacterized protein n=1 Tax=Paramecium pentaurelia TaxID=43138 RepID=A0A8S1SU59_9CILI|nr:unnamed protein product [Paramecium pentaurelia]
MIQFKPDMFQLINQWGLEQHQKKNLKSSQKINLKTTKIIEEQLKQSMEIEKQKLIPHKERSSEKGTIEFLIYTHDECIERLVTLEEDKNRIPIVLCDYLLQKIKFGRK